MGHAGAELTQRGQFFVLAQRCFLLHKRLLQMLQWTAPNERWVLKAPIHLFGLKTLLKTYPDARIIFIHRDPFEAMTSGVSMVSHWTQLTTGQVDIPAIAGWYPALWAKGLEKALAVRDQPDLIRQRFG